MRRLGWRGDGQRELGRLEIRVRTHRMGFKLANVAIIAPFLAVTPDYQTCFCVYQACISQEWSEQPGIEI